VDFLHDGFVDPDAAAVEASVTRHDPAVSDPDIQPSSVVNGDETTVVGRDGTTTITIGETTILEGPEEQERTPAFTQEAASIEPTPSLTAQETRIPTSIPVASFSDSPLSDSIRPTETVHAIQATESPEDAFPQYNHTGDPDLGAGDADKSEESGSEKSSSGPDVDDPYAPGSMYVTRKTLEDPETGELDPNRLVNTGETGEKAAAGDVKPGGIPQKEEWMESELEKLKREEAMWASRDWTDSVEDAVALLDPTLEAIIQMVSGTHHSVLFV
jgi:hypothetical protein